MTKGKASRGVAAARHAEHLGVLLGRARRRLYERVAELSHEGGFTELGPAHSAVFGFLRSDGARLTTLARRARITKQSMGELVRELERLGYVRVLPDPTDKRAKIVTFTERGRAAHEVGMRATRAVEAEWARQISPERTRQLRSILEELTSHEGVGPVSRA